MKTPAIPSAHKTDSEEINKILAEELQEFFTRHPKCEGFTEIFDYLRSLEVSQDVAADVAKSLLWAECRASKANLAPGENGRFVKRFTTDMVATLLNEAGRSWTDLCAEARAQFGMGKSTFAKLIEELHTSGRCYRTQKGVYGIKR
jgi:hypothetical protein